MAIVAGLWASCCALPLLANEVPDSLAQLVPVTAQPDKDAGTPGAAAPTSNIANTALRRGQYGLSAAAQDWRTREQLANDPVLSAAVPGHCEGMYLPPRSSNPEAQLDPADAPLRAAADATELDGKSTAYLLGEVQISEGYRELHSDSAIYHKDAEVVELEGNVRVREPGLYISANRARFDGQNGTGEIEPGDYVLHEEHIRGYAEKIRRREDETLLLSKASFTHCEPGNNSWLMRASRLELDQEEGVGKARHARVNIRNVPVFYSPYLEFPLDDRRRSGILWPSYSNTSNGGVDIAIPYYFNLAPNYDATLTPRFINTHGLIAETEFRWLNKYSNWVFGGSYLDDDEATGEKRWLATVDEYGQLNRFWNTRVDFTRVSDDDFFNDLSATGLDVSRKTHLDQLAEINFISDNWAVSSKFHQFQTIALSAAEASNEDQLVVQQEPYRLLPQVEVRRTTATDPFRPNALLAAQYTYFGHNDLARGHRAYVEPGFSYPMEWLAGFIKPTVKLKHASYMLENIDPGQDEQPSYTVPVFSLDNGLYFERNTQLLGSDYVQTLEPRLYYLHSRSQAQDEILTFDTTPLTFSFNQLFRDDRFSGHDRVGDANQLTLGVSTRFIDDDRGEQKLVASIGQIFYFEDRTVTLNNPVEGDIEASTSEVAGELEFQPRTDVRMVSSLLWNPENNSINQGSLQLNYEPNEDLLVNFAYRYRRESLVPFFNSDIGDTIEQTDVSAVFPLGRQWQGYMRWQYDIERQKTIEDLVGVQYSDCCWDVRLVYQRVFDSDNEREHGIFLQFALRGLGAFGNKISAILDQSIQGYSAFRKRQ